MKRPRRIVLALLAFAVLATGGWRGWLHWRVASLEAELRAAGNPVSMDEWADTFPANRKNSSLLVEAFAHLDRVSLNDAGQWDLPVMPDLSILPGFTGPYTPRVNLNTTTVDTEPVNDCEITRYLEAQGPALALIESVMNDESGRMGIDLQGDAATDRRTSAALNMAGQYFALRSMERTNEGDFDGAVADAIAARRVGELFPVWSLSSRSYQWQSANSALIYLLEVQRPSAAQLRALQEAWYEVEPGDVFRQLVRDRFCRALSYSDEELFNFGYPLSQGTITIQDTRDRARTEYHGSVVGKWLHDFLDEPRPDLYWIHRPNDRWESLRVYQNLVALSHQPPATWTDELTACRDALEALPWNYRLAGYFSRNALSAGDTAIRDTLRTRCILLALAVERYGLATGALPVSADALVPDYLDRVPNSPFDDAPLEYERHGKSGYTVGDVTWAVVVRR